MLINQQDIWPDVNPESGIIRIEQQSNGTNHWLCVLGVLETPSGIRLKDAMLEWLMPEYDVWCICQKAPGRLFEYPALRFAQWMSLNTANEKKLLYVHTKGAANPSEVQHKIRSMWKKEFTGQRAQLYINDASDVTCPLRGPQNETWYNGMFISQHAFSAIGTLVPQADRYAFQRMFRNRNDIKVRGIIKDNINCVDANTYIMTSQRRDFSQEIIWTSRKH